MWKPTIEWDESGECFLYVETEFGDQTEMLHIEDPEAFYDSVKAGILPWLMERDEALRSRPVSMRTYSDPDAEPYDISDPKHPDFHSVHADLYDSREGK